MRTTISRVFLIFLSFLYLCGCDAYTRMSRDSLIQILHVSGTQAIAPDRQTGYGVPQTSIILQQLKSKN